MPQWSKKRQPEIQRSETSITANETGDDNIPPTKITTTKKEGRLLTAKIANEFYMPLSSTIVLKRKAEMLYVPLYSKNGLTTDALVDSGAYASAIVQI